MVFKTACSLFDMDMHDLRQTIRLQRRALSVEQQSQAAQRLCEHLSNQPILQAASRVALYLANDGEIDPALFSQWAFRQNIQCYLPVIGQSRAVSMQFAEFKPDSEFRLNRFSIPEPQVEPEDLLDAAQLDVVLMPLVAFDYDGNRIGMGGGFYDRTLAFKIRQPYHQPPDLIGLAHSFQALEKIVPAPWDVPLDGIATEQSLQLFN